MTDLESPKEITQEELEELRKLSRSDLYVFAKGVCGFSWLIPHIHLPLCRILELYDGYNDSLSTPWEDYEQILIDLGYSLTETQKIKKRGLKKLQITLPRGWLKTTLGSQAYPLWRAIRDPNVRVLLTQNTFTNAVSKLRTIKDTVDRNDLFRLLYPEILPTKNCVWKSDSLCLTRSKTPPESTFEAAGTRTQITSRHYDVIIEDDTVAPELSDLGEENLSPTKDDIEQAIGWHRLVPPLLISPMESQNLVIGTRWFEKDLISWIHEREPQFVFYERACLENKKGEPDEQGEVTYPERFNEEVLDGLKSSMGTYLFSCLYMNKPIRSTDMVFQPGWISEYETEPRDVICYTTVDLGGDPEDTKGEPDYNVVMTCGKDLTRGFIYVLTYWREKASPGQVVAEIFNQVKLYKPVKVGIETTGYQKSIKYWIRERMQSEGFWFLIEDLTHTKKSKNLRIIGLQPLFQSHIIHTRKWMGTLISELMAFPLGRNDDLIDTLASQLELWTLTQSKRERRVEVNKSDPFSVDQAIDQILNRNKNNEPAIYDVFEEQKDSFVFN